MSDNLVNAPNTSEKQNIAMHSLLYIRPDSKSTMDALIADLLKMISINIRVN